LSVADNSQPATGNWTMSSIDLPLVFAFGFLGSLHCIGMCGPIVVAYSLPLAGSGATRTGLALAHLAYNAGRITTYTALGAVAGTAGHALGLVGRLAGAENVAAIIAGVLLLVTGLSFLGMLPTGTISRFDPMRLLSRLHGGISGLLTAPTRGSKFKLGLALGFLPCGFLYAGLLKAVEAGSALSGAGTMLAFGTGTACAMIATGMCSSALAAPLRRWGNCVAASGMILLGGLLLYRGIMAHGMGAHSAQPTAAPGHEHMHH
jgi:uncharacterized protein